jgi:hypothetical protein
MKEVGWVLHDIVLVITYLLFQKSSLMVVGNVMDSVVTGVVQIRIFYQVVMEVENLNLLQIYPIYQY